MTGGSAGDETHIIATHVSHTVCAVATRDDTPSVRTIPALHRRSAASMGRSSVVPIASGHSPRIKQVACQP